MDACIRKAEVRDFDRVADINKVLSNVFERKLGYIPEHVAKISDSRVAEISNNCFVYYRENEILGAIIFGYDSNSVEIFSLAVDSKVRGCGVGKSLVDFVKEDMVLKGVENLNVVTWEGFKVEGFYKKMGFEFKFKRMSGGQWDSFLNFNYNSSRGC